MNYLKDNIVKSLLFVLVGAILIFNPGMANNTIAGIISLILVINGVVHIIGFIRANGKTTVDGYKSYGSSSGLIIGIPPPTLASNKKFTLLSFASLMSSAPCAATSSLFDVATLFPARRDALTKP